MKNQKNSDEKNYKRRLLEQYQQFKDCPQVLEHHYEKFFDRMQDAVFLTDVMGCFIYFNEAAEMLTGYKKSEIMGRHFRMLFTLDDLNDGFLFFYQTIKGCYSEHSRFRIRRQDGSTRVIDALAAPVLFDGRIRAALTVAQDITGIPSGNPANEERVRIFRQFTDDLERWNAQNDKVKKEIHGILLKLSDHYRKKRERSALKPPKKQKKSHA